VGVRGGGRGDLSDDMLKFEDADILKSILDSENEGL